MPEPFEVFIAAPSTTFAWRKVKVSSPPEATQTARPKGVRLRNLPKKSIREGIGMTVKSRGGAECWVEIHARGAVLRVPGHMAIIDILRTVCNDV